MLAVKDVYEKQVGYSNFQLGAMLMQLFRPDCQILQ
jgi:hypothetical protein